MVTTSWSVYVTVVFFISTFIRGIPAQSDNNGICGRMFIRNTPSDLMRLSGCKVIEGSLQIALISEGTPEQYKNYSFPLREITGYLLLYNAHGLQTLRHIFPNLTVIRGQEFIHNYYALLVMDMPDMQEIGLPALTNILQGKVWIYNNQNLCYLDTIDWGKITNDTHGNGIKKNKPNSQCPNTCPDHCPAAEQGYPLCWSNEDCQRVEMKTCPCDGRNCEGNDCCSDQCLGGCTGPGPNECFVCKNVEYNGRCMSECPYQTYMYLKRRCITDQECSRINLTDPSSKKSLHGKRLDRECVLECPKGYEEVEENGVSICRKCEGHCKKVCPGLMVDSVEASTQLKGCTRIQGSLKIQIRGYTSNLGTALAENLDMIEEIDDYLVVAYTYSLLSLNFFTNLKAIHGNKLEENTYALVVKSNENIANLWTNRTVKISNKKGRVLFHYNPKLCPQKIREFVKQANIMLPKDERVDIGITNGDKVPCNQKKLMVKIRRKSNSSVTIVWENFLRNLTEPSHLLNYEVSYKEAPTDVSPYDDRDPCGQDDWKVLDVPKTQQASIAGQEPEWEEEKLINNLKYFTRYALYVKTVVIPDENSPNNNTGAESDVMYFVTLPDEPSAPTRLSISSNSSSEVAISWYPPESPNGELETFEIYIRSVPEDVAFQDTRNYCKDGRVESKIPALPESTTSSFMKELAPGIPSLGASNECCSCSGGPSRTIQKPEEVQLETDIESAILNKVFIPNPDPIAYIGDGEHVFVQRRRRRRGVDETSQEIIVFPGESRARDEPNGRRPGSEYNVTQKVPAIANDTSPHKRYEIVLRNLTHFTRYRIGVVACRKKSPEIENDTRICSEMASDFVQTKSLPSADEINPNSVFAEVTGNTVRMGWEEPPHPNGVVLAYEISVRRVDKPSELTHNKCVTRKQFQENGRNFTYPDKLHPGNYSYMIRTVSLAADSNFTTEKFFSIENDDSVASPTFIIFAVVLPVLLIILLAILLGFYYVKSKRGISLDAFTSANPEYMPVVDIPEEWEVPRDKVFVEKELGQGSFGMVYEGLLRDFLPGISKMKCAVKTVSRDAPSEDRARFLQEALIMTQINSHHVVKLLGVVSKTLPTFVVMELMARGDLKQYLRSRRPDSEYSKGEPPPTLPEILRMASEIADGMAYLDYHSFVHRDLAARNCMVADDKTVKVGDFGMTKDVVETEYYRKETKGFLPIRWMAPESIRDGLFTNKSDVWSYGVVLWEMATLAAQPYQGLMNDQVLRFVRDGGIMEKPEGCPSQLYDLMHRCWQFDPRHRPTFADILDWLVPSVNSSSFQEVSFYYSPKGLEYRTQVQTRANQEELITVKTPLRATCESDDDLDEYDDDHDHSNLHSSFDCDNENGILLPDKTCNGGVGRVSYITGYPNTSRNSTAANNTTTTTVNNNRMQSSLQNRPSNPNFVSIQLGSGSSNGSTTDNPNVNSNGLTHRNVTRPLSLIGDKKVNQNNRSSPPFPTKPPPPNAGLVNNVPDAVVSNSSAAIAATVAPSNLTQNNHTASSSSISIANPSDSLKGLSISYSNEASNKLVGNGGTPNGESNTPAAGNTPAGASHPAVPGSTSGANGYVTLRRSPVTENYPKTQTTPL